MNPLLNSIIAFTLCLAIQADAQDAVSQPLYKRMLQGEDAKQAEKLQQKIEELEAADDYAGAVRTEEKLLALRIRVQGGDHWETVDETWLLDGKRKVAALPAEQRASWRKAVLGTVEASNLEARGQCAKAQPLWQEYRRWCEQVFGEKHPNTASSFVDLAANLHAQEKLEALRQAGELTKYRYLHFATHGEGNDVRVFESAVILAQDTLPEDLLPRPASLLSTANSRRVKCWNSGSSTLTWSPYPPARRQLADRAAATVRSALPRHFSPLAHVRSACRCGRWTTRRPRCSSFAPRKNAIFAERKTTIHSLVPKVL